MMAKTETLHSLTVIRDSQGRHGKVKLSKFPADRNTRKRALRTVFDELNANTFRERRAVLRRLYAPFIFYVAMTETPHRLATEFNQWMEDVRAHSGKLADLLSSASMHEANFTMYGIFGDEKRATFEGFDCEAFEREEFESFIERLREIQLATMERVKVKRGPPRKPALHLSRREIVGALDDLYTARIGKPGGAGRRQDHHRKSVDHGKPSGPFFRLVKAALTLVGDKQ